MVIATETYNNMELANNNNNPSTEVNESIDSALLEKIDSNITIYPSMTKEYLKQVVEELNLNCLSQKKPKNDYDRAKDWDYFDDYSNNDIDFDFSKCRKYCMIIDIHYCYNDYVLCDSCENILEERIRKPFNKTSAELQAESCKFENELNQSEDVQKKIDVLVSCVNKLTTRVAMLEGKVIALQK